MSIRYRGHGRLSLCLLLTRSCVTLLQHLPSFEKTLELFYRADVVMGPHGAAMANLLASRPGTTVVEVHCTNSVRSCFRLISQRLGMRYFATRTTKSGVGTHRCNREGLSVNISELRDVTAAIAKYLTAD